MAEEISGRNGRHRAGSAGEERRSGRFPPGRPSRRPVFGWLGRGLAPRGEDLEGARRGPGIRSGRWTRSGWNRPTKRGHSFTRAGPSPPCLDVGQPIAAALVLEDEPLVIDAEQIQQRGLEVVHVHAVANDVVAEVVGLAVG